MYMATILSLNQLGSLIRDKKVGLDNGSILFGFDDSFIDDYFKSRLNSDTYVVGIRGRLNDAMGNLFKELDSSIIPQHKVILEAKISESEVIRMKIPGLLKAAEMYEYGLGTDLVEEELDEAVTTSDQQGVEVICVPLLTLQDGVRVTSFTDKLKFEVDSVTFVALGGDK